MEAGVCLASSCENGSCSVCSNYDGPADGGFYWPDAFEGKGSWYWSSSYVEDVFDGMWTVGFMNGSVFAGSYESGTAYVACVR